MKLPEQLWLEDYGLVGDLRSAALIGADGSVSWLCLPNLDSPSVFGALLDAEAGFWRIRPAESETSGKQRYWQGSNVLDTTFDLPSGQVTLTDFMPLGAGTLQSDLKAVRLIRRVQVTGAACDMVADFAPRPQYGKAARFNAENGLVSVQHGQQMWFLWSSQPHEVSKEKHAAQVHFTLQPDQTAWFALIEQPLSLEPEVLKELLDDTHRTWANWLAAGQSRRTLGDHPHRDLEIRSALVLKLLSSPGGAIAAAPTTSLPEVLGGSRNWDYRYCWLRDSTFTAQALHHLGHREEAADLLKWFGKASRRSKPRNLKIAYTIAGEAVPAERALKWLGYKGSRPVHIGNGARNQKQLDVYGEVMAAYFDSVRYGKMELDDQVWQEISGLAGAVCDLWKRPDKGIWEARQPGQQHTYSKLMCWVALDRAVKLGEQNGRKVPGKWKKERDAVREMILDRGFNPDLNSFTQTFGGTTLDATSLMIPLMGFLPPDDVRVLGTLKAVQEHLADGALVRRYNGGDGMEGQEGYFILCSFWLISAEALCGQVKLAQQHFDEMLGHCSPLGLLAEEITPDGEHLLGNFPQAYSHVGLINALAYLQQAQGRFEQDDQPLLSGTEVTE
ncbi:glycoside hydrolase family 15 protein [Deinococcus rubellus]|uniref:Glycoside hydrolase family 15 protein n=1 Tax=Deinococcus rubellus TaxID=1889240 RepID=A0ABY5YFC4_9DEIO|nr:glycoside hydrolase family 15 protein [Deinococcus rubellus]UWX63780.1 glycoside hydrolase family 15 protein [Deinococcus rubellus]